MTRAALSSVLLFCSLAARNACFGEARTSASHTNSGLRARSDNRQRGSKDEYSNEKKHQSVIRRLYGPENGEVRKHIRMIEERLERSRTGFLGDPNHEIPYENHPYQKTYDQRRRERERILQDETEFVNTVEQGIVNTNTAGIGGEDLYKPMRIRFETQALDDTRDAENAAKIDFFKTRIFPE